MALLTSCAHFGWQFRWRWWIQLFVRTRKGFTPQQTKDINKAACFSGRRWAQFAFPPPKPYLFCRRTDYHRTSCAGSKLASLQGTHNNKCCYYLADQKAEEEQTLSFSPLVSGMTVNNQPPKACSQAFQVEIALAALL